MRRSVVVLAVLVGSGRLAFGCSSDAGPSPGVVDAGTDVVVADVEEDRASPVEASDPDPVPPPGLPDGWEIERTYSKHCGVYVPKTKEKLPPRIRWEACPAIATPAGADCRLMAIEGDPADKASPAGAEVAAVKADGSVLLGAYRSVQPGWIYQFIVDADGPVHAAYLLTDPHHCLLANPTIDGERYAMRVFESSSSYGGGFIAGEWASGALGPRLAVHLPVANAHTPYAGSFAIIDLTTGFTLDQYSWTDGAQLPSLWSAAKDNGLQQGPPVFAGGAAFWPSDNLRYQKVKVYTPTAGVRDFLSAGMVTTHGFDDLGTDGKDLVWLELQGRSTETGPYDTLTIMTAPFTTEPVQVVPRRLRTEDGPGFGVSRFIVGCGYAARSTGTHIRVVRLADGQSWVLSNALTDPFGWSEPLAVTCTELFATIHTAGATRLARVRLDSLGPGVAPD